MVNQVVGKNRARWLKYGLTTNMNFTHALSPEAALKPTLFFNWIGTFWRKIEDEF